MDLLASELYEKLRYCRHLGEFALMAVMPAELTLYLYGLKKLGARPDELVILCDILLGWCTYTSVSVTPKVSHLINTW